MFSPTSRVQEVKGVLPVYDNSASLLVLKPFGSGQAVPGDVRSALRASSQFRQEGGCVTAGVTLALLVCDCRCRSPRQRGEQRNLFAERGCCRRESHFLAIGRGEFPRYPRETWIPGVSPLTSRPSSLRCFSMLKLSS